ncbi:MAG: helix-turn-helix domain-containing protein [Bacillota bacterium]|nr:helix-turn-helix domain-containing protein [Bacillota bacterium]
MKTSNCYSELLQQFPEYMTKNQMYKVCHISKKTCLFLLENGLVPCIDSGKKTRRFKIETNAVVHYLEDRELRPELYRPPEGFYKKKQSELNRALTEVDLLIMRKFYEAALKRYPDVLTTKQISKFTGYRVSSVVRWCSKQQLKNFYIKRRLYIPKEYLIDFLVSWHFIGISVKSGTHRNLNKQILLKLKSHN